MAVYLHPNSCWWFSREYNKEILRVWDDVAENHNGRLIPFPSFLYYTMDKKVKTKFKKFLANNGVNTMFAGLYKDYRHEDNAKDVDEFLASVPAKFAISWAMDYEKMPANNAYGVKFWNNLDAKWKAMLEDGDFRKPLEATRLQEEEREVAKEEKKQAKLMLNNWAGLDLVNVRSNVSRIPQPDENEIRITTKSKHIVVLNQALTTIIDDNEFNSVNICNDVRTNRLVLVFGKGCDYNITKYTSSLKAVQYKGFVEYISKYLEMSFVETKAYYVKISERVWNKTRDSYAIVLSQKVIDLDVRQ